MRAGESFWLTPQSGKVKPRPLHDGLFHSVTVSCSTSFRPVVNRRTPSLVSLHFRSHSYLGGTSSPPSMDTHRPRPRARRRDSDTVLRASVLDAAIELGISNTTVAKWMFSPVEEGDEEEEYQQVRSPTPPLPPQSNLFATPSRLRDQ